MGIRNDMNRSQKGGKSEEKEMGGGGEHRHAIRYYAKNVFVLV
jgi:hypothetical protein